MADDSAQVVLEVLQDVRDRVLCEVAHLTPFKGCVPLKSGCKTAKRVSTHRIDLRGLLRDRTVVQRPASKRYSNKEDSSKVVKRNSSTSEKDNTPVEDHTSGKDSASGKDSVSGTNRISGKDSASGTNHTSGKDSASWTNRTSGKNSVSGKDRTSGTNSTSGKDRVSEKDSLSAKPGGGRRAVIGWW